MKAQLKSILDFVDFCAVTTDGWTSRSNDYYITVMIKACDILKKRQFPCCAHTLNLIIQDALSLSYIKCIIAKCKKIVTYFESTQLHMLN